MCSNNVLLGRGLLDDRSTRPITPRPPSGPRPAADRRRRRLGPRLGVLRLTIAPNGLDVSHLLRCYTARGFRDEGRSIITLPV
jgi:hypothetical protein